MTGYDRTGEERRGEDRTGQDRTGQDRTGQDRTGQEKKQYGNEIIGIKSILIYIKLIKCNSKKQKNERERDA